MKWSAKRVESSGVPCLDAGSTPATSTLSLRFMSQAFFVCIYRSTPATSTQLDLHHCKSSFFSYLCAD